MEKEIERYIDLKYKILKAKFIYYTSPTDKKSKLIKGIPDEEYDKYESEYRKLHETFGFGSQDVSRMVGWDPDSRDARFAMMMVFVNAMDEREYNNYREMILRNHDYDISAFRDI